MLQTGGAAEGAVLLTERSVQTRLQELHSAQERLALLQAAHREELGLLGANPQSYDVVDLRRQTAFISLLGFYLLSQT